MIINKDLIIQDNDINLENLVKGSLGTQLWYNYNHTSDFSSQDIILNLVPYTKFLIVYKSAKSENIIESKFFWKGNSYELKRAWNSGNGMVCQAYRWMSVYNNKISFGGGTAVREQGYESSRDDVIIPLAIIAYKEPVFDTWN